MISLKKSNKGFTIVELLIVIVVIGILAALVITTYAGIQSKARNGKRSNDIQSLQTQVEAFYTQNSFYPSLTDLNSKTWRATNMPSLDKVALVDPSTNCDPDVVATCVSGTAVATPPVTDKKYHYVVTDASGATCEALDTSCAQYTLTGIYEGTVNNQAAYVKKNLD